MAVKSFRRERDSAVESQNNGYLQGNSLKHENILVHRAAVLHYDTFYIFMDLAPYGDLETLLSGGTRRDNLPTKDQHYNVTREFPDATLRDVLKAFRDLTAALKFLHHDVRSLDNGESMKLAHNDLRPQNVLIFQEQGQPIGRWKITDFGISTLKSKTMLRQYDGRQVIGDILHHPPRQARERSMEGPHRAPEFSSTIYDRDRKADIWSLGCIFADVMAFMQGFYPNHDRWSKSKSQVEALRKIYGRSFYDTMSNEDKTSFTLKPKLRDWLTNLAKVDAHHNECVGVACLMLRPDPDTRKDAGIVGKRLNRILTHMQNEKPYTKPFELAREQRTLEKWCPPLLQRQTTNLSDLDSLSFRAKTSQPEDEYFSLTLTRIALMLTHVTTSKSEIVCVCPIETLLPTESLIGIFQLPSHIQWKGLELSGSYGCVTGTQSHSNTSFEYLHFDLVTRQALPTDESLVQDDILKQAVPASNGLVAFCYDKCIKLRAFSYNLDESLTPPEDGTFRMVAFSDNSDKLFARISFHEKPRQDLLAIWEVSLSQRPSLLASFRVERPSQKVCRDDFYTILPWTDHVGGLIIYLNGGRGIVFTALANDQKQEDLHARHQGETHHCPASATTAAAATTEHFAFVDVKGDLWLYRLDASNGQGGLALESLGPAKLPVKKASWFVLRRSRSATPLTGLQLVVHEKGRNDIYDVKLGSNNHRQRWELVKTG